ncbi:hypothetical protein ACOT81_11220 [Streptomyces sp. WI04-05B]|uniref:hypothetical protein n=1 Tax=Streptomyces TaxID=1883 RepID=UPI0029A77BF3|nr:MULTISPECIES: hypothetical protein [unclassified Streptomyces]MDX2541216.1 hypothetical protein [Streptomyces sp. WI04-05B]MDX2585554.1 hypothetical protein [Streptomyces sp. WI04-05A]MDX3751306.1 hypothetical protein [Streptomyces sp. AK08-02]
MGVRGSSTGARVVSMDTLMRVKRGLHGPPHQRAPLRLPIPAGMTAPLGCDAVAVPARFGPQILPRLPRVGCVYADSGHWWWLVPADSDYALEWPAPAQYATGAVVLDATRVPPLLHRPQDTLPYTPPIPLYLALCQVTGTIPTWSRPISA